MTGIIDTDDFPAGHADGQLFDESEQLDEPEEQHPLMRLVDLIDMPNIASLTTTSSPRSA
jgi:hypothetical protein